MLNVLVGIDLYGVFVMVLQYDGGQGDDGGDYVDQLECDGVLDGVKEVYQEFFVVMMIDYVVDDQLQDVGCDQQYFVLVWYYGYMLVWWKWVDDVDQCEQQDE